MERRLVYCDLRTGKVEETGIVVTDDERVIINEGLPIEGGVLFGTKHLEFNKTIAALYYYDAATRTVRTVFGGQICSNGKFFTREKSGVVTLVDIDSLPKTITRYTLDARMEHILDRSLITPPESLPGFPDGLRPAPDGQSVIVAFYNPEPVSGGRAQQICLASGKVLCEWTIPGSPRVTCPEFAMIEGKVKLLFTTAVEGMAPEIRAIAPAAGTLFVADTSFSNVPAPPPLLPR
jgi:sugar lactone lactonase YvrE